MQNIFSERIGLASLLLLFVFSLFGWYNLFHGTFAGYGNLTLSLLLGFSFACMFFFLGAILWHERYERILGATLPFLPVIFFAQELVIVLAVIGAILLSYFAIHCIRKEKSERIRFQYFRVSQAGQVYFVTALALTISIAYFTLIRQASWEELVPKLRLGESTTTVLLRTLATWQPELATVKSEGLTVDEYLMSLTEEQASLPGDQQSEDQLLSFEVSLIPGIEESLRDAGLTMEDVRNSPQARTFYLESGHRHFTWLVGGEVRGNEPINAVMSQVIQRKIIRTLDGTGQASTLSPDTVPTAIAVVLFLALIPLGTLLGYVWLSLGYLFFLLLLRTNQLEIREHLDEVEELEITQ
ncbi:MAG: hypothetical protein AAB845_02785 [Patescibacteria group bacterium]